MALSDDIPGLGALGSLGAIAGDLVLNGGDFIVSAIALLITSPDIWVTIVLYTQRLGDLFGFSTDILRPLIAIGTMLLLIMYVKKFIERLLSET